MTVSRTKLVGIALVIFAATVWLYWPSTHGGFLRVDDLEYLRQSDALERPDVERGEMGVYVHGHVLSPAAALVPRSGLPDLGNECGGSPRHQCVLARAQCRARVRVPVDALGRDILDHGRAVDGGLVGGGGVRDSSVASGIGGVDVGADATAVHDVWDRQPVGVRRRARVGWVVWGLFVAALLCKPMAVSLPFVMLAMDYFPLRRHEQLGWGRLVWEKAVMIALAGVVGVATVITESRGRGPMAPLFVGPAVGTRVPRVRESDVLSGETGLAGAFVAQLRFGPPARSVDGVGVGAHCSHHHGGGHHVKTTHANAGGGVGGLRDAGSSHVRRHAEGPASGGARAMPTWRCCRCCWWPARRGYGCGGVRRRRHAACWSVCWRVGYAPSPPALAV